MTKTHNGRPITRFLGICPHINEAYGDLRTLVRQMGYVPQANRGSSVEQYALGYIREIAAQHLPAPKVKEILAEFSDRKIWKSASHMQAFVPALVREAIHSGGLTAEQFVEKFRNRETSKSLRIKTKRIREAVPE